jgi:cytosine deaminase
VGCKADLVLLQASNVVEALRLKPTRLFVFKGGKVISQTPARKSELSLEGRPHWIDMGLDYVPK